MAQFEVRVKYVVERVITVTADSADDIDEFSVDGMLDGIDLATWSVGDEPELFEVTQSAWSAAFDAVEG